MAIIAPVPFTEMPDETQFRELLWMTVEERGKKEYRTSSSWVSDLSAIQLDIYPAKISSRCWEAVHELLDWVSEQFCAGVLQKLSAMSR